MGEWCLSSYILLCLYSIKAKVTCKFNECLNAQLWHDDSDQEDKASKKLELQKQMKTDKQGGMLDGENKREHRHMQGIQAAEQQLDWLGAVN